MTRNNWQTGKQQQIMVLIALDEFQKALIESYDHHIRRSYIKNVILELLSLSGSKQDTTTTGISTPSVLLEKAGAHIFAPKRYPESCEEWEKNTFKNQLEKGYSLSNSKGALVDFVLRRKIWINNNWTWIWILGDAKFTSDDKILDFNSVVKPVLKKCEEAHKNLVPNSSEGSNQPSSDVPFGYMSSSQQTKD
ncbi:hypothetical protein PPL_03833 [Heterostelium album PN500]|uniref:Uncharacterized protein n=1 Tax=Heterostelium pallidum (strain ATCC 26659 / Pp 5 / PN500) TaxID=670386 RepID=D3B6S7_HETP5|nr:hypothetical protein PPL_03833 [Heterostelium album PN500]EFA83047.1 hypothetical protein PPL_03833 [Heterostelium album PN500]|eukprot:XP_020435164.1 hypothetical protein PPL_03833 [Heterostelium album PN500]